MALPFDEPAAVCSVQGAVRPRCSCFTPRRGYVVSGSQNSSRAHQALQQASLALRMQQFSRAEQLATEVLKSNRTDKNAVLILAHALIAQNRAGESIVPLERAVRRSSDLEIDRKSVV